MTDDPIGSALERAAKARRGLHAPFELPVTLHPKQQEFYDDDRFEVAYGGAASGGKTLAQLASASKFLHVPGHAALMIRESFTHHEQPSGLVPLSREWFSKTGATYNATTAQWRFPSGAVLAFGHAADDGALHRIQGAEYQSIHVDEATQLPQHRLEFLYSRLRKRAGVNVPLRMRFTMNPGGISHDYFRREFVEVEETPDRRFIAARVTDNPSVNAEEYTRSLSRLDPLLRARLLEGDWSALAEAGFFKRHWFQIVRVDQVPRGIKWVRFWDLAATQDAGDFTAGALVGQRKGVFYLADMQRFQCDADGVETRILQTARMDGKAVRIFMEQEPGSSGKTVIAYYAKRVLRGFAFKGVRSTGSKIDRARPVASAAEMGNLKLVEGPWLNDFLDEASAFPLGPHDDMIDALSGGFAEADYEPFRVMGIRVIDL